MVDKLKFLNAKITVLGESYERDGIGTLSERSLHRILKSFYEPSEEFHEVEFLGSIADIKNSGGIIEIQTRAFERLVPKLRKFLPVIPVTVVLPLAREKTLRWIDTLTGEISTPRKSPKKETVYSSFRELYKIREFIPSSNLTVKLVFLSVEEYKYLNAKGGKRGAVRMERIPNSILEEVELRVLSDYASLMPAELDGEFTVKDFARAAHLPEKRISYIVGFLREIGIIEKIGVKGRAYLYKISNNLNK